MKNIFKIILVSFFFSTTLLAGVLPIGEKVPDFSLKDYNGKSVSLSNFKNKKAIVLMFIATQCPVSNAYNERMATLANEFSAKGVQFIGVNSNKQESVEEIKEHSSENKFSFPVLKDWNNTFADKLGATVTPEIFVLKSDLTIMYHGRIDDNRKLEKVSTQDLRSTLDELLSGKEISKKETKAFGCTIKKING